MEERLNQMNAVLQSMQKSLECNICLDLMNKPLTTKCGHSFCSDCIHQVVKNARSSAQCPLCLCNVTRRSLGQNRKITGLVSAVRDVISSIKKDCCFEVTPSKYRPRRQPLIPCEEDDSENEENDEPRRGMRKRAVTSHYNAEVSVPKPRARSAKQRILAASGGEELNLCMNGKTEMTATNTASLQGGQAPASYIAQEHSYSSPTKQEPHERSAAQPKGGRSSKGQPNRGRGKATSSTRGKSRSLLSKSGKLHSESIRTYLKKDSDDDHMSASQHDENKIDFNEDILKDVECLPNALGTKLVQEKSTAKVEQWLNNSSEVGFRIGVHQSSESSSALDSEISRTFQVVGEQAADKSLASLSVKACDGTSPDSKGLNTSGNKTDGSSHSKDHTSDRKFFKSKLEKEENKKDKNLKKSLSPKFDEDDIATVIFKPEKSVVGTPEDPFKFIPSQKTPKQKVQPKRGKGTVKSRARGALVVSRGRTRGRGRGVETHMPKKLDVSRNSIGNFGLAGSSFSHSQSTPIVRGKPVFDNIDISVIRPNDTIIQAGVRESHIAYQRDDDDDDYEGIPDSCPVNTKDEFDEMVSDVKNKSVNVKKTATENIKEEDDDDKEEQLLFITPAQATETIASKEGGAIQNVGETSSSGKSSSSGPKNDNKKVNEKSKAKIKQDKEKGPSRSKLSKSKNGPNPKNSSGNSSSAKSNLSLQRSKPVKAEVDIDAICALFDDVEDHELSMVTAKEDEKQKKHLNREREDNMRRNISWHNETLENTELNKTISCPDIKANDMPPPKAPATGRKVKFLPGSAKVYPIPSVNEDKVSSSSKSASSESTRSSSRVSERSRGVRNNIRYGSEMKQKILDPSRVQALSVNIKDTKSPGWSHVTGARQDLKTRHTSLKITGGELRNTSDTRTESGILGQSSLIPSSVETNVVIDDETQDNAPRPLPASPENDVEHLQASQSKIELVRKLKTIVQQLKKVDDESNDMSMLCENEIPESIRDQMESQQKESSDMKDLDSESALKGNTSDPDLLLDVSPSKYPTETEPFDCSQITSIPSLVKDTSQSCDPNKVSKRRKPDALVRTCDDAKDLLSKHTTETEPFDCSEITSIPSSVKDASQNCGQNNMPKKRKADAVVSTSNDAKDVESRPSKVARKTFSLSKNLENVSAHHESKSDNSDIKLSVTSAKEKSSDCATQQTLDEKAKELQTHVDYSSSSNGEDVKGSTGTVAQSSSPPEMPRLPHHTLSPSIASTSRVDSLENPSMSTGCKDVNGIKPQVIPFRSVGALCTNRCAAAADQAPGVETCGRVARDLCLHSIPCEVYQVLMKYMNVLVSQQQHHSGCCGDVPEVSCERGSPTSSKEPQKTNSQLEEDFDRFSQKYQIQPTSRNVEDDAGEPIDSEHLGSQIPSSYNTEEMKFVIPISMPLETLTPRTQKGTRVNAAKEQPVSSKVTQSQRDMSLKVHKLPSSVFKSPKIEIDGNIYKNLTPMKVHFPVEDSEGDLSEQDVSSRKGKLNLTFDIDENKTKEQQNNEKLQRNSTKQGNKKGSSEIPLDGKGKRLNQASEDGDAVLSSQEIIVRKDSNVMEEYLSSSCEIDSSQQSTSLLSTAELGNFKPSHLAKVEEKSSSKLDKSQLNPKSRERNVNVKNTNVDIEKENLRNCSSQLTTNRSKRKPLQSGTPVHENIMSQVSKGTRITHGKRIESSQAYRQLSHSPRLVSQKIAGSQSAVLNSENHSSQLRKGNPITSNDVNDMHALEDLDEIPDSEGDKSPIKDVGKSSNIQFKRIKRPPSSSSDDSDSESITASKRRKAKVLSGSSGNSLSGKVAALEKKESDPQHILDSEEMRDMERCDQNVWAYFGHPDEDLMEGLDQSSPIVIDDASQKNPSMDLIPSDEEMPNTADVERNVAADLALVNKMRNKEEESQVTVDLTNSQGINPTGQSSTLPSFSSNTKNRFMKLEKSVTKAEDILDCDDSLFQNLFTPSLEKRENAFEVKTKKVEQQTVKSSASTSSTMKDVVTESDDSEGESGDYENISHSSAFSSASETINTQERKQVQSEVEILKAKVRELEAKMGKQAKSKQDSKPEEPSSTSHAVKDKSGHVSDEELFCSLPDFNPSTEPSLPSNDKPIDIPILPSKPALPPPAREVCHLVCTGLNKIETIKVEEFIKKLAPSGSSFQRCWGSTITHVVVKTDEDMYAKRTLKYLYGVAAGCWVVSLEWVFDSISQRKFLPELKYEVFDSSGLPGPRRGRTYLRPFFENYEFFLKPPFSEVSIDQLKDLLELCGARLLDSPEKFSKNRNSTKLIIVSDGDHDTASYLKKYQKVCVLYDWIIECVGMHSYSCIKEYVVGNPDRSHLESSGIFSLMEETQELTFSQDV